MRLLQAYPSGRCTGDHATDPVERARHPRSQRQRQHETEDCRKAARTTPHIHRHTSSSAVSPATSLPTSRTGSPIFPPTPPTSRPRPKRRLWMGRVGRRPACCLGWSRALRPTPDPLPRSAPCPRGPHTEAIWRIASRQRRNCREHKGPLNHHNFRLQRILTLRAHAKRPISST